MLEQIVAQVAIALAFDQVEQLLDGGLPGIGLAGTNQALEGDAAVELGAKTKLVIGILRRLFDQSRQG